ncbi:MAG: YraN family protein [Candidimonas sp.]|nr:MAG: YraN family protein [Burkholderiales bacterium 21-58-4]TAL88532.1 MAG: YraN family protein [Candidimonas sp.]TAM18909.1 MAG: YraN family protein [Candidimonas sp.]TAM74979.1 MAG: YraN family protein [Candidimonas sp.]
MPGEDQIIHELAQTAQKAAVRRRRRRLARPRVARPDAMRVALSPTQRVGQRAEQRAKELLEAAGVLIVGQNLRCKAGEIDLIGLDRTVLVFIEVRHRHDSRHGGAAASVNRAKQQRLIRSAHYFLPALGRQHFGGAVPVCRFDVVTVEPMGINWIKQAFTIG